MQRNTGALPGPTHEPTLGDQQPAPPNSDSVPIDLVPALYMVGAALPRDCDNILLDSAGRNATPTIADLLPKLVTGLQVRRSGRWRGCPVPRFGLGLSCPAPGFQACPAPPAVSLRTVLLCRCMGLGCTLLHSGEG